MREDFEFRVSERHAHRLFSDTEGRRLGFLARKIVIAPSDPRFQLIGKIDEELWADNRPPGDRFFFSSWSVVRKYRRSELVQAKLFHLIPLAYFEPAGEECGTIYDDGPACGGCLAGAKQIGPLFLELRRIPKRADLAISIASEIVVSQRLFDLFTAHGVTGASFHPVREKKMKDLRPSGWYQLVIHPPEAEITAATRTGNTPFDDDSNDEHRCSSGDTIGLNFLSELTVSADSRGEADVVATRQLIGRRAGLLRPRKSILVAPKVRQIIEENNIKGCRFEVAHLA